VVYQTTRQHIERGGEKGKKKQECKMKEISSRLTRTEQDSSINKHGRLISFMAVKLILLFSPRTTPPPDTVIKKKISFMVLT
jgi:hypothetical protein